MHWQGRGGRPRDQGLAQAAEAGDETVQAGQRHDTDSDPVRGQDQPQLAALGHGPPVRSEQDT